MIVTVLMSIYNEPIVWMSEAIESILNQTFTNFEFIIINDKPDRPENKEFLNNYAKKDSRIVIVENETNLGLTKSLNKGLKIAKGKYIARMDADDISLPNRLQLQFEFMEAYPDCLLVGAGVQFIDEKNRLKEKKIYPSKHKNIENGLISNNMFWHPTLFFNRAVFDEFQIYYNEKFEYSQDYEFVSNVIAKTTVSNLKDVLIFYRKSSQQISNKGFEKQNRLANLVRKRNMFRLIKRDFKVELLTNRTVFEQLKHFIQNNKNNVILKQVLYTSSVNFGELNLLKRIWLLLQFRFSVKEMLKLILITNKEQ